MGAHCSFGDCGDSRLTKNGMKMIHPYSSTTGSTWIGAWTPESILEELQQTHMVCVSETYPRTFKCTVSDAFHRMVHYNAAIRRIPYKGRWILDNILLNTTFTFGGNQVKTVGDAVFAVKAWTDDSDRETRIRVSARIREHTLDSKYLEGIELEDIEAATSTALTESLAMRMECFEGANGGTELSPLL